MASFTRGQQVELFRQQVRKDPKNAIPLGVYTVQECFLDAYGKEVCTLTDATGKKYMFVTATNLRLVTVPAPTASKPVAPFKIGDRVEMIREQYRQDNRYPVPVMGQQYTVRECYLDRFDKYTCTLSDATGNRLLFVTPANLKLVAGTPTPVPATSPTTTTVSVPSPAAVQTPDPSAQQLADDLARGSFIPF